MKTGAATPEQTPVRELYAEGLRYLMGEGGLNNALARLCEDLERHRIDYMVIGAVALMAHGYPRFTEDIDLVLTREGLEAFHRELDRARLRTQVRRCAQAAARDARRCAHQDFRRGRVSG